ncbi:MAG TPA: hypothetical protein VMM13_09385 [Euzebya sp.]|nr:hypothetical protein [Euzebya sp.]
MSGRAVVDPNRFGIVGVVAAFAGVLVAAFLQAFFEDGTLAALAVAAGLSLTVAAWSVFRLRGGGLAVDDDSVQLTGTFTRRIRFDEMSEVTMHSEPKALSCPYIRIASGTGKTIAINDAYERRAGRWADLFLERADAHGVPVDPIVRAHLARYADGTAPES